MEAKICGFKAVDKNEMLVLSNTLFINSHYLKENETKGGLYFHFINSEASINRANVTELLSHTAVS
jgi:hypothetical protein